MTKLDTTGRTRGAGDHFWIAGKEYVWVLEYGRLKAQRFDRQELLDGLRAISAAAKAHLGDA